MEVRKHASLKGYKFASMEVWKYKSMLICKNLSIEG